MGILYVLGKIEADPERLSAAKEIQGKIIETAKKMQWKVLFRDEIKILVVPPDCLRASVGSSEQGVCGVRNRIAHGAIGFCDGTAGILQASTVGKVLLRSVSFRYSLGREQACAVFLTFPAPKKD